MSCYVATFYTHLAALTTARALANRGVSAKMMPAPRKLSSSCGTCLRYEAKDPCLSDMDVDMEQVCTLEAGELYTVLIKNA
ncbi:DUF3343 domain-containing protein [Oscillibacter sp.]|uniref:DUF3343 domain-containing protein n=1 Tax=Oscillibacter sp. TaxID=1945593 RepID=UPI0028A2BD7F|nr:DUF3343 domain-containing protein [Oscillibacter sp.]